MILFPDDPMAYFDFFPEWQISLFVRDAFLSKINQEKLKDVSRLCNGAHFSAYLLTSISFRLKNERLIFSDERSITNVYKTDMLMHR